MKGSQRSGGKNLAHHLLKPDNEHVDLHEMRGFVSDDLQSAFHEIYGISKGTRCRQYLFSLSMNPPQEESVSIEVFENAIGRIEEKLGFQEQARAIVFHEKEGRRHAHVVWSRIDVDEMKAIPLPHFKRKLNEIAKELYIEHDWKMPDGFRDTKLRNPLNFTRAEWEQAKRSGYDPKILKSMFQECWASSDNKESFSNALKENGFYLARGDRRGFVAVDHSGSIYSIPRFINKRAKDVKAKIGQSDELPSITETKRVMAQEMTNVVQKYIKEADNIYTQKSASHEFKRIQMTEQHKAQRAAQKKFHEERHIDETRIQHSKDKLKLHHDIASFKRMKNQEIERMPKERLQEHIPEL